MKKILVLMLILLLPVFLLSGCLNNQLILSLSYVEWYTTTEEIGELTFGYVYLNLSGSTTGDKVTVITYGDGVIDELELDLDQDKKFSQDIVIKFTHAADNIPRKYSTVLTAYKGSDTTKISLESEELTYLE
ncbi:hypothetical protein ES695_12020 [Candidatus Atribacteria bacterium 1244-E10-H5-B2]|nr:MAG: hypothetical protein ES695_12020 [Candidatus Atribacteria bacterium 1244-E10-H5-B2]